MQTSMKYSSENPNGLQARKQEVGKLLSYDTENTTTDNCSKSFTDRICNCGSTSKKKKKNPESYIMDKKSFVTLVSCKITNTAPHSKTQTHTSATA